MAKEALRLYADDFPNKPVDFIRLMEYVCRKDQVIRYYLKWDVPEKRSIENNRKLRDIKDLLLDKKKDNENKIEILNEKPIRLAWIVSDDKLNYYNENDNPSTDQSPLDDVTYVKILQQYLIDIHQLKADVQAALQLSRRKIEQALERIDIAHMNSSINEEEYILENHLSELSNLTGYSFRSYDRLTLVQLLKQEKTKKEIHNIFNGPAATK